MGSKRKIRAKTLFGQLIPWRDTNRSSRNDTIRVTDIVEPGNPWVQPWIAVESLGNIPEGIPIANSVNDPFPRYHRRYPVRSHRGWGPCPAYLNACRGLGWGLDNRRLRCRRRGSRCGRRFDSLYRLRHRGRGRGRRRLNRRHHCRSRRL